MPTIRVEPSGIEFETSGVEAVLFDAERAGYRWPTVCGGKGTCRTCYLHVESGADQLTPVDRWEAEGLRELGLDGEPEGTVRLACQVIATGDVVVRKPGVRKL